MDVNIIIGGRSAPLYPNCDGTKAYTIPYPRRIAGEYARGNFTFGWPVAPAQLQYQRTAIAGSDIKVGDAIWVYAIPERHVLNQILFRVLKADARMNGAAIKPVAQIYTAPVPAKDGVPAVPESWVSIDLLDTLFESTPLTEVSDVYASIASTQGTTDENTGIFTGTTSIGYFVPPGKTLLLGFEITTLPTDTSMNFALTDAEFALLCKVGDFDVPLYV